MNLTTKLAIGGVGAAVLFWASGASAKGNGGPVAPPHPKPPPDEPPPDEPPAGNDVGPWENNEYPTPGKFYQVAAKDIFLGTIEGRSIVHRALLSEGYLAATQVLGMGQSDAFKFARAFADDANRRLYYDLILCTAYNDAAFGTWGWDRDLNVPGPHGRAIALLPTHADNRQQLAAGLPVLRNVTLGKPGDLRAGIHDWKLRRYPYLFLPGLDREAAARGEIVESQTDLPFDWSYEAGDLTGDRVYGCGQGAREF